MIRILKRFLSNNAHLLVGILIGIYISSLLTDRECLLNGALTNHNESVVVGRYDAATITNRVVTTKPNVTRRAATSVKKSKPVRPRYYSTELGIRQKIFVGVLSSEEGVNKQIVHLNKTIGHLVDKIKFFITAQYKLKTKFNLTGLVGFTDTRHKYRPFQVIKYIADSFLQDFDYYFIINDHSFVNVHRLKDFVDKISVSRNIYVGSRVVDSSYCSLDAGILLSNSVLRAMHQNLESCLVDAVGDDHSENVGRCVYRSTKMDCQEDGRLSNYKIRHFVIDKYLKELSDNADFNRAVTINPVVEGRDFYLLNAYFAKQRLIQMSLENKHLAGDLSESWPAGQRVGSKPLTRFDVPRQFYFNTTHMYFPDDFTNVAVHTKSDFEDIQNVIEVVKAKVLSKELKNLQFRRLINGYRTFDLSRGLDYLLDLGFRDLNTGKEVIKRFEVCKPLGKVEFVPAPYVTENTRVTIFLPLQENEKRVGLNFIENYSKNVMEQREKTFLMLVLLYQYDSHSKGKNDVFYDVKNLALKLSTRFHDEDTKIAWVSIRLPKSDKFLGLQDCSPLNYAVTDLALKKIGLESLILLVDPHSEFTPDFINRVRMNTISGFQIFNPIPFRQYDPKITQTDKLDVHKNIGHFDREQYKYVSFYARDYVKARKKSQHLIPITRTDNDIARLPIETTATTMGVFEMFVKYSGDELHCMRATEMSLKVKYHEDDGCTRKNQFYASKPQLAKLILKKSHLMDSI